MTDDTIPTFTVSLRPGTRVLVRLEDTDGEFAIEYGKTELTVKADLFDTSGRGGTIYCEEFGAFPARGDEFAEHAVTLDVETYGTTIGFAGVSEPPGFTYKIGDEPVKWVAWNEPADFGYDAVVGDVPVSMDAVKAEVEAAGVTVVVEQSREIPDDYFADHRADNGELPHPTGATEDSFARSGTYSGPYFAAGGLNDLKYDIKTPGESPDLPLSDLLKAAGLNAPLPSGYQWGDDAMESFAFGKKQATRQILLALAEFEKGKAATGS